MDLSAWNIEPLGTQQFIVLLLTVVMLIVTLASSFFPRRWCLLLAAVLYVQEGLYNLFFTRDALINTLTAVEKVSTYDDLHLISARCIAILLIMEAVLYFRLKDRDSDPTIFTSIMWSRIVEGFLSAINILYALLYGSVSKQTDKKWTYEKLTVWLFVAVSLATSLSCMIQLLRCPKFGGYPESRSRLNLHLRIDYLVLLIGGILSFALPHWFITLETTISKPGQLHLFLARATGMFLIGTAVFMGKAPNILRDADKVTIFECRLLQNALLMLVQMYARYNNNIFTVYHLYFDTLTMVLWTINAGLGYFSVKGYPKVHLN